MRNSGGVGCASVLLIVFVALKLTGNIDWPWLWVLSPLWGSLVFWILVIGGIAAYVAVRK